MANSEFPDVDDYSENTPKLLRSVVRIIRNIMQGKTNNTGTCTLGAGVASTNVDVAFGDIGPLSTILFMPLTANAATEFGAGSMYVSAITITTNPQVNRFTITHANNANVDRTFRFVIIG